MYFIINLIINNLKFVIIKREIIFFVEYYLNYLLLNASNLDIISADLLVPLKKNIPGEILLLELVI